MIWHEHLSHGALKAVLSVAGSCRSDYLAHVVWSSSLVCVGQFLTEAAATLGRRSRGKTEDVWLQSPLYPEYYRTFHYQARGHLIASQVLTRREALTVPALCARLL